jgi:hypothetical protein
MARRSSGYVSKGEVLDVVGEPLLAGRVARRSGAHEEEDPHHRRAVILLDDHAEPRREAHVPQWEADVAHHQGARRRRAAGAEDERDGEEQRVADARWARDLARVLHGGRITGHRGNTLSRRRRGLTLACARPAEHAPVWLDTAPLDGA